MPCKVYFVIHSRIQTKTTTFTFDAKSNCHFARYRNYLFQMPLKGAHFLRILLLLQRPLDPSIKTLRPPVSFLLQALLSFIVQVSSRPKAVFLSPRQLSLTTLRLRISVRRISPPPEATSLMGGTRPNAPTAAEAPFLFFVIGSLSPVIAGGGGLPLS